MTADGIDQNMRGLDRKQRLLDAAIVEFSRRGLAGARIDSIAKAAGANKQLLYHYFGDKAELERAVMSAVMRRQDQVNEQYTYSGSLQEQIAQRYRDWSATPLASKWGRLLAWEALEHDNVTECVHFEERCARFEQETVASVRQAQASGEIDAAFDAKMLALVVLAMELIPRVLPNVTRMVTGLNGDDPKLAEQLIATMDALISRLGPATVAKPDAETS